MTRKTYGSANSQARTISSLYGGARTLVSVVGTIRTGGLGNIVSFDPTTFVSAVKGKLDDNRDLKFLQVVTYETPGTYAGTFVLKAWCATTQSPTSVDLGNHITKEEMATFGVNMGNSTAGGSDIIDLTPVYQYRAKNIAKLYGSVGGQTRLIHQGFGHLDYGYGIVEYYTDSTNTTTDTIILRSQSDVDKLSGTRSGWSNTIQGAIIGADNIRNVILTSKVTSLPTYFLYNCSCVESVDISRTVITVLPSYAFSRTVLSSIGTLPSSLTTIEDHVLHVANYFSQVLVLPTSITSIGIEFLTNLRYSSPTINIGSLNATVAAESDYTFSAYNLSSVAYTQGVYIAGANRTSWLTRFPDSSRTAPYRKLIDAGY